jgi:hypothetical protein
MRPATTRELLANERLELVAPGLPRFRVQIETDNGVWRRFERG